MMKRIIAVLLLTFTVLSLAACGSGKIGPDSADSSAKPETSGNADNKSQVLFEKTVTVVEGTEVRLAFLGKDGSADTITVSVNGYVSSDLSVFTASEKVIGRDEPAVSDDPEFRFFTEDINYDGYLDFGIQAWEKEGVTPYYCWFWNTLEKNYVFGAELEDPIFDVKNSKIYCNTTDGGKEYLSVYTVSNGALSLTASICVDPDIKFVSNLASYEQYMNPSDRDGYLILANKENSIGEEYEPDDLTEINYTRPDGRDIQRMRLAAAKSLDAMCAELYAAGYDDVTVTSAYRSAEDQRRIFDGFLNENLAAGYDYDTALAMVLSDTAYPGTSEHQTGLCCDMHSSPSADVARTEFPGTPAYKWLTENAWKFGFILRYPEDKVDITGYTYESWHYRFVGRYHAAKIHALGLCFEEYLELFIK